MIRNEDSLFFKIDLLSKQVIPTSEYTLQPIEDRVVGKFRDEDKKISVSTVFLGMNMAFLKDEPQFFETMIFGLSCGEEYQRRFSTYDEAVAGHEEAIRYVHHYHANEVKEFKAEKTFFEDGCYTYVQSVVEGCLISIFTKDCACNTKNYLTHVIHVKEFECDGKLQAWIDSLSWN